MYTTTGTTYKWRPLPSAIRSFRLLTLKGSTNLAHPVEGTLQEYTADAVTPEYFAISYLCGEPRDSIPVHIEGHSVNVYATLESALRHFRWANQGEELVVWADAICIDQMNLVEKSEQVANLNSIYRDHQVLVWLGDPVETTALAFEVMERLTRTITPEDWVQHYVMEDELTNGWDLSKRVTDEEASAVAEIFHRSYWTRLWTFQELILAKEYAVMFACGTQSCSAHDLSRAFFQMSLAPKVRFNIPGQIHTQYIQFFHKYLGLPRHKTTILEQFIRAEMLECADERDKIFIMVNMSEHMELRDSNLPDYNLTLHQVHQRLIRSWIEVKKNLDILMMGSIIDLKWPVRILYPKCIGTDSVYTSICDNKIPDINPMWASGSHSPQSGIYEMKDGNTDLVLEGFVVSSVAHIGPWISLMNEIIKNISTVDIRCSKPADIKSGSLFWRLLQLDRPDSPMIQTWKTMIPVASTSEVQLTEEDFWLMLTSSRKTWRDNKDLSTVVKEGIEKLASDNLEAWPHKEWAERYLIGIKGKAFFSTKDGHMGFAIPIIEAGDLICVLFGGQLPFIIRPMKEDPERYILVGECYLYGVMDGEALVDLENGKYQRKWFRLAGSLPETSDETDG